MSPLMFCVALAASLLFCRAEARHPSPDVAAATDTISGAASSSFPQPVASTAASREPNEHGRIPILEYHLITESDGRWSRSVDHFRRDLETLYARGYRPVTVAQLADRQLDLPAGLSPVVFTFDDASPGQFSYVQRGDSLVVDPRSAVGVWLDMHRRHPEWGNRATFCVLPAAKAGHAFFGDRGIDGQKTEWRFQKLKTLADFGFELCGHTLWHAQLHKYPDAFVQEQIARGVLAIDSAVPGYRVRSFALPLGSWPVHKELATRGRWRDPKSGRETSYDFDAVLEVAGGPVPSPHTSAFDAHRLQRIELFGDALEKNLDYLEKTGTRYVSDGDPTKVTAPTIVASVTGAQAATTPSSAPSRTSHRARTATRRR